MRIEIDGDLNRWPQARTVGLKAQNEENYHVWPEWPERLAQVSTSDLWPLKIVKTEDTSFKVIAGEVGGFTIAEQSFTSITTTKYVWVEVTQGYGTTTGIWTPSAAAIATPAGSYGSATATKQIVQLGYVTCSGSVITSVSPQVSGSQGVAREGSASAYSDRNWLV